jgi:hypothetical protein
MEAADWLYGVSMGGDGVSKIISRRLPPEQAAAAGQSLEATPEQNAELGPEREGHRAGGASGHPPTEPGGSETTRDANAAAEVAEAA